jgi:hypothetical protein
MDAKEIQYLAEGLSVTVGRFSGEIYQSLLIKGKKRLGQETRAEAPAISDLIRKTRKDQVVSDLLMKGKKGREEFILSIGAEVKKILSSAGIVTRSDLARVQRRIDEIGGILSGDANREER